MKLTGSWVLIVLIVLVSGFVTALDDDIDGVKDEFDACADTPYDAVLPIIKVHTEYLGCSCEQIEETMGNDLYCVDIYCFGGKQLAISERSNSATEVDCGDDYCVGLTLYDFPEPEVITCSRGKIPEGYCIPKINESSQLCQTGQVAQKKEEVEIIPENIIDTPNSGFADEIYDVVLENEDLKSYLDNPNRKEFEAKHEYVQNKAFVTKEIARRNVGGTEVTIPLVTINIVPNENTILRNVVLFERINADEFDKTKVVSFGYEPLMITDEGIVVWKFEEIPEEGLTLKYQLNLPVNFDSETMVVAKVTKKFFLADWWPILIIPIVGYLTYWYIMRKKDG